MERVSGSTGVRTTEQQPDSAFADIVRVYNFELLKPWLHVK